MTRSQSFVTCVCLGVCTFHGSVFLVLGLWACSSGALAGLSPAGRLLGDDKVRVELWPSVSWFTTAYLLLPLPQHLHDLSVLFLLLLGLGRGGLVLLGVRHGNHGEDEVDEVERAEEDHNHEEDHVGFTSCSQCLQSDRWVRDRQVTYMQVRARQVRDRQVRDRQVRDRQVRERQVRDRQVRDRQVTYMQVRARQVRDRQVRDRQGTYMQVRARQVRDRQVRDK